MAEVHAVLLIPAEDDPLGLLAGGPCGARPPVVYTYSDASPTPYSRWGTHRAVREWQLRVTAWNTEPDCAALVLAWDGEVVPEGVDRVERAIGEGGYRTQGGWLRGRPDDMVDFCRWVGEYPEVGRIVLLDAEGHEVTP